MAALEQFRVSAGPWQVKAGTEKMTAVKEYMVETQTKKGKHLILRFKLVYNWLVFCHLIAGVSMLSATTKDFFPGAEDSDLSADI